MKYIFANWKMYLDVHETMTLTHELLEDTLPDTITLGVFPTALAMVEVERTIRGQQIILGAQHVNWTPRGAYTGAMSAHMFERVGCTHALVGHSERRHIFGESNEGTRKRLEACLDVGITPMLCVGETQEDRDRNKTTYRLKKQLMKALEGLPEDDKPIMIAYEPVWAIAGSGKGDPCLPSDAEDMHGFIKQEVQQHTKRDIPVLYGGSVDAENVVSYLRQESIDGVLVGHASTTYETFSALIKAAGSV